ncbi:helix-turn-helix domain-containing protein [Paenibacillus sp. JNUCC32]|uniref:helix-turn-helix domain-containing protein n=1 Tax=Paenibacillus sp. JNUCC32 TaxID=2777984 RepID=UPI001E32A777|nr:helix-turn-helix transcriptional regulator [Paenibacillus sp. JNUCC-32]
MMSISEQVKPIIDSKGLNPSELAHLIGCSPQYMHNLLNGSRRWNETTLNKICDALDLEFRVLPKIKERN